MTLILIKPKAQENGVGMKQGWTFTRTARPRSDPCPVRVGQENAVGMNHEIKVTCKVKYTCWGNFGLESKF